MMRLKKWLALGAGLILAVSNFVLPVFGAEIDPSVKIYDYADVFTDEEEATLQEEFSAFVDTYYADVVFVTTNDVEGKSEEEYADDFFDYNGFGLGDTRDGSLYLLNMEDHNFWLSTRGLVIEYVTDSIIEDTNDKIRDQLRDEDYIGAARSYLEGVTPTGSYAEPVDYRQRVFDTTERFMHDQGTLENFGRNVRKMANSYKLDVTFQTVTDFGEFDPDTYAKEALSAFEAESASLGESQENGGLIMLVDDTDQVVLAASGDLMSTLGMDKIGEKSASIQALWESGDLSGAFASFIEIGDLYADQKGWQRGTTSPPPTAGEVFVGRMKNSASHLWIYLLVAGGVGGIVVLIMRGMNKTAVKPSGARGYMKENSLHLSVSTDVFIRSQIDRREKPKDNGSSSGGGSSTHTSSSGASHGGGGGSW